MWVNGILSLVSLIAGNEFGRATARTWVVRLLDLFY